MKYKLLFLLVEGNDDERFFERIIKPKFEEKYNTVEIWQYAKNMKKVDNFLKSIRAMDADYIYVTDINDSPCVTAKKQKIQKNLKNVDEDKIIVVIKEIESWYFAGLNGTQLKQLKIRNFSATDIITKEQFNNSIPNRFDSRIDFMLEILKIFSIETAKRQNISFRYCIEKVALQKTTI